MNFEKYDFEINVHHNFMQHMIDIYITAKIPNGKIVNVCQSSLGTGDLEFRVMVEGSTVLNPFLRLQPDLFNSFIPALINGLSGEIKPTDNDWKIKGNLESKNEHIKDLQMIISNLLEKNFVQIIKK
jgi:hypothetical protein